LSPFPTYPPPLSRLLRLARGIRNSATLNLECAFAGVSVSCYRLNGNFFYLHLHCILRRTWSFLICASQSVNHFTFIIIIVFLFFYFRCRCKNSKQHGGANFILFLSNYLLRREHITPSRTSCSSSLGYRLKIYSLNFFI